MSPAPDPTATTRSASTIATRRGALLVAGAAACWSSGALITRLVTTGPWTTTLWRSLFASLFLAAALRLAGGGGVIARWRGPVVPVALCMALASTCFIFSLSLTSVANTLILMSTGPYVAGLLGWLLLGERVAVRTWLTMAVALAGAVVMVSSSPGGGALAGDLLAIVMAAASPSPPSSSAGTRRFRWCRRRCCRRRSPALVALPLADPLAHRAA